jgi:WD40 repeat protein/DNA/RNA endonuclease YhcR with UshA esterase domain
MSNSEPPMPPSNQHEEALFAAALERPASERAPFLDGACHGDPALRQRLDALLAAHDQPDTLLATQAVRRDELPESSKKDQGLAELGPPGIAARPTIKLDLADVPDETIGQKIGRYKILEKVGEGGCGVVYVAEQTEPVRRRVALKVIKLGMDTKQVVARFEAERQALALMDHPNIAKVLDAGTTDVGRPYFVMELVRGIKITDYCDQAQCSTKERLDLFIKVCQAIQHAHQKGIIHRDIKPSNILVTLHDGVPVPKVIDFGIAKATEGRLTDATVYTQLHQFIGTPAYMSPEQAEMSGLDIDTRSDIYSLGVLLYELLAGSTPFDAKELMASGIDQMRKTIREKEPPRPSTRFATLQGEELTTAAKRRSADQAKLLHQLKGDLDWIVMKCLEKDRTRRYETANGLAADLKRHLNNEPVVARPPSAAYKFQKLARRNKLAFAAVGAVTMALVLGIIASTWQAVRATRATREALSARQQAEEAERQAQKNFDKARAAEEDARQQAASAQEVSDRSSASFMLGQGRLREALAHARAALAHADTFENRLVATAVVEAARDPFTLDARVVLPDAPLLAAALTETRIVIASASALYTVNLPDSKPSAHLALPGTPMHLIPLGPDRFLMALPDRLLVCAAAPLAIETSIPIDDAPLDIAATSDGRTVALLFTSRVEARDGKNLSRVLAFAPVKLRAPRAGIRSTTPFRVSISPSGNSVLAAGSSPNAPNTLLNVITGTNRTITTGLINCRLIDDASLVGLAASGGSDPLHFWTLDCSTDQLPVKGQRRIPNSLTAGARDLYIAYPKTSKPDVESRLIFAVDSAAVDLVQFPSYSSIGSRRVDALWPHENGRITRIGISPDAGKLFLAASNQALIFAVKPSDFQSAGTVFWSVAVTPDAYYTIDRVIKEMPDTNSSDETVSLAGEKQTLLTQHRFDQPQSRPFAIAWPEKPAQPWGLAVTPDGRTLAVLCQESSDTSVDGTFFEKYLLIYSLPSTPPKNLVPIATSIHLEEFSGVDGRVNGRTVLSPDGTTVLFTTSSGQCRAYSVSSGVPIWSASNLRSTAVSPTGDLLASGDYSSGSHLEVRDVATGRVIYSTPKSYKVRKLALTFDQKLLAAVDEDTFLTIDLASGTESSSRSPLCPVALSPDGTRLVAFLPEEPGLLTGSTVLADSRDNRILDVLNPNAHLLNFAAFTPQGDRIVLGRNRYSVMMISADPWERLSAALEVPNYPFTELPRSGTPAQFAALHPLPLAPVQRAGTGSAATRLILRAEDGPGLIAHLGAEVEVEGTIATARWSISGAAMMIDFEGSADRSLLAAVFSGYRKKFDAAFPPDAASFLAGKIVRIRGKLERYGGKVEKYQNYPQIILNSPEQLTVLSPAPKSLATITGPRIDAKDHAELAAHLNAIVTIFGTVHTAAWSTNGAVFNLGFEKDDEQSLLVVIFPKRRAEFERVLDGDLEKALTGKRIELWGKLQTWKNRPEIILESPTQLRLLPANASPGTQ